MLSVVLGWLVARIGHTHIEAHVPRRVFWRRVAGAALMLLGIGVVANIAPDLAYAQLALENTYQSGSWTDTLLMLGWLAMGLAAVTQARRIAAVNFGFRMVEAFRDQTPSGG